MPAGPSTSCHIYLPCCCHHCFPQPTWISVSSPLTSPWHNSDLSFYNLFGCFYCCCCCSCCPSPLPSFTIMSTGVSSTPFTLFTSLLVACAVPTAIAVAPCPFLALASFLLLLSLLPHTHIIDGICIPQHCFQWCLWPPASFPMVYALSSVPSGSFGIHIALSISVFLQPSLLPLLFLMVYAGVSIVSIDISMVLPGFLQPSMPFSPLPLPLPLALTFLQLYWCIKHSIGTQLFNLPCCFHHYYCCCPTCYPAIYVLSSQMTFEASVKTEIKGGDPIWVCVSDSESILNMSISKIYKAVFNIS